MSSLKFLRIDRTLVHVLFARNLENDANTQIFEYSLFMTKIVFGTKTLDSKSDFQKVHLYLLGVKI